MITTALREKIQLAALTGTDLMLTGAEVRAIAAVLPAQDDMRQIKYAAICAETAPDGKRLEEYERIRKAQGTRPDK